MRTVIELLGEPKGKGRHKSRMFRPKDGRHPFIGQYPDPKTKHYETLLRDQAAEVWGDRPLLDEPLLVRITAQHSIPRSWSLKKQAQALAGIVKPTGKPDCDNLAKVKDALKGVVWRDDALVVGLLVWKVYSERPLLRIEIEPFARTVSQAAQHSDPSTLPLFAEILQGAPA